MSWKWIHLIHVCVWAFLCVRLSTRVVFWTLPRRGSSGWSSAARFPFAPAAASWGVRCPWSACAGCTPGEEEESLVSRCYGYATPTHSLNTRRHTNEKKMYVYKTAVSHSPGRLWDWVWSPPGWSEYRPTCTPDGKQASLETFKKTTP